MDEDYVRSGPVIREGDLSERSLVEAVADEHRRRGGPCPLMLLVSSKELEQTALRILNPSDLLSSLRAGMPFVKVAGEMKSGWMLVAA